MKPFSRSHSCPFFVTCGHDVHKWEGNGNMEYEEAIRTMKRVVIAIDAGVAIWLALGAMKRKEQ